MSLPNIIIDKIQKDGPLSFRDFMEMALYYPGQGYYMSDRQKLGRSGDFYTSAYLTRLFGDMIAGQLEEMWHALGQQPFTIVEFGAGTGLLCQDILHRLKANGPLWDRLSYIIIEKSVSMRNSEKAFLPSKVRWVDSIRDLPPVTGCILSNELVDNFSVHRVIMLDELMEVCVTYDGRFVEILRPAADFLKDYLRQLGVDLPRGFTAEINLEATKWIMEVSEALHRGFVMTIDYGYTASDLYSKKTGTLACYHRHQINYCPYDWVGEQDITSHVNFSALDHWGRQGGLECCGFTSQTHFLQAMGLARHLRQWEEEAAIRAGEAAIREKEAVTDPACRQQQLLQLRTLLLEMGHQFKVLIQRKGLGRVYLSGMQFAQPLA